MLPFIDKYLKTSQSLPSYTRKTKLEQANPLSKFKIQKPLKNFRVFHIFGEKDMT